MSHAPSFRPRGFTMLELLVIIVTVGVLVVTLVPAISKAKSAAQTAACATTLHTLGNGLGAYSADSGGYTPVLSAVNGGDFTPPTLGKSPAGKDIWGIPPGDGGGTGPAAWAVNRPLGLGALISGNYTVIDQMFCPTQRVDSNRFWRRRQYWGDAIQTPWNTDGENWSPWYGGSNYYFHGSYTYRSGDWSTFSYDPVTKLVKTAPAPIANASLSNLRPSAPGYGRKSILVESAGWSHLPRQGGNVLWGDGGVTFWKSPEHYAGLYTRNWDSVNYPNNPLSGDTFHGGFMSLLMDAADNFARE